MEKTVLLIICLLLAFSTLIVVLRVQDLYSVPQSTIAAILGYCFGRGGRGRLSAEGEIDDR